MHSGSVSRAHSVSVTADGDCDGACLCVAGKRADRLRWAAEGRPTHERRHPDVRPGAETRLATGVDIHDVALCNLLLICFSACTPRRSCNDSPTGSFARRTGCRHAAVSARRLQSCASGDLSRVDHRGRRHVEARINGLVHDPSPPMCLT